MKTSALSITILAAAAANAHSIFQRVSINGVDQGYLNGVRSPAVNNPIYDVTSASLTCNTGLATPVSTAVLTIPAGAQVASFWQHVLGGPQFAGDPDNPIAATHHGPIEVYLAAVPSNPGTATPTVTGWFKIASDGLTNGAWGVDHMVANGGWANFTMPTCVASGNYLMRVQLIALHSAYESMGAQFYGSCANIIVTGGGSLVPSTVSIPGAWAQNDPGVLINIYGPSGNPDNGGLPYTPPGPAVISCTGLPTPASTTSSTKAVSTTSTTTSKATTTTSVATSTTTSKATTTSSASGAAQTHYGQCGGQGWTGATACASPYTCTVSNAYYSQCL